MTAYPTNEHTPLRSDPWRIAWNILAGDALLVLALLALALLLALAAWLPQAPDSATAPAAFSRWLAETQTRIGGPFAFLQQAGLFILKRSPVVHALVALVALCLTIRLFEAILSFWRAQHLRSSSPHQEALYENGQTILDSPGAIGAWPLSEIAAALERRRFRVVRQENLRLYADRFPLADAGRIAVYVGALLVVAGLTITGVAGWRVENLIVGVGQTVPVGHGTPYSLRLGELDQAGAGQVGLLREADSVGQGNLAFERPMEAAGLAIFITGWGPAIRASATFTDGNPLYLQTSATSERARDLLLLFTPDEPDHFFAAPDAGLGVRLSRGASNSQSVRAQVYRTGQVVFDGDILPGGRVTVENVVFVLSAETYAVLQVVRDPGVAVTLTGLVILALGLTVAWFWPVRRVEAISDSDRVRLVGDWNQIQLFDPTAGRITVQKRLLQWAALAGWQVGLAILSVLVVLVVMRDLMWGGVVWPRVSVTPAFWAAWLVGGVAAILPARATRWATVALALVALAAVLLPGGAALSPGL